jgi:hypothetical protein
MKANELKFVLKLLGYPNYRAPLNELKVTAKSTVLERERLCRELAGRELVAYSTEIQKFRIEPPGKALLRLKSTELSIAEAELTILQACRQGTITIHKVRSIANLQALLKGLSDRGLIKPAAEKIKEVWLSDRGKIHLREDCSPTGNTTISFNLLNNYLRFLRKPFELQAETISDSSVGEVTMPVALGKPNQIEVLDLITRLDQEVGSENYLPIYYLRDKLQSVLTRLELDEILFHLQRNDKIELSSLQEAIAYTPDQIDAGIPQEIGGALFFISVL